MSAEWAQSGRHPVGRRSDGIRCQEASRDPRGAHDLVVAAAGLAFRYAAYGSMPVAPGEPYGEADVLELAHYGVLLAFSGLVVLQGLVLLLLGRFQLRPLAAFMCVFGLALPFVYRPLHSWVAALAVG